MDCGQDQETDGRNIYQLPPMFSTEAQEAFSFFVHLKHIPQDMSCKPEVVQLMEEALSEVSSPFYIGLSEVSSEYTNRDEPQYLCDRWSVPVEIGWVERRIDHAAGPAYQKTVFLSQIIFKEGFIKEQLDDPPVEYDSGEENEACHEDSYESSVEDEEEYSPWLEAKLPTDKKFYARGTHVDDAGQI